MNQHGHIVLIMNKDITDIKKFQNIMDAYGTLYWTYRHLAHDFFPNSNEVEVTHNFFARGTWTFLSVERSFGKGVEKFSICVASCPGSEVTACNIVYIPKQLLDWHH